MQSSIRLFHVNNFVNRMVNFSRNDKFHVAVMQTDDMLDFLKVLIKYYIMSSNFGKFVSGNSFFK